MCLRVALALVMEPFGRIAGETNMRPCFLLPLVFLVGANSRQRFWACWFGSCILAGLRILCLLSTLKWLMWEEERRSWLANCDELLEFRCDFLMVAEHRRRSHMMGMREWEYQSAGSSLAPPRISRPMLVWGGFFGAWFWLVVAGFFLL